MIRYNAITAGKTVVRDPKASGPESKSWFRITSKTEERIVGENIASRSTKVFSLEDLRRLEPARDNPFAEIDLTALLGQKVRVELAFGKNTGIVTEIHTRKTTVFETEIEVPVGISLDSEILRWPEIKNIEPA